MPEPMTAKIAKELAEFDFSAVTPFLTQLQNPKTAMYATKCICGKLDNYGLRIMVALLDAALVTKKEIYEKKKISEKIFIDTMKNFTISVQGYHGVNGSYGFDFAYWMWRHFAGMLFRLGTLEFEIYKAENSKHFEPGTPLLSVHIPSDAVLSREELDNSYLQARKFFKGTEYENAQFYCDSWLLSPKLRDMLPEDSGILRFMNDYKIIDTSNGDTANIRVFKMHYLSIDELPEKTSLQRKLKQLLATGENLGEGAGVIIP